MVDDRYAVSGTLLVGQDTMSETFDLMAQTGSLDGAPAGLLKKAVGFRNISVHNYRSIDWAIVHAICRHKLGYFDDFARAVVSHMEK